MCKDGKKYPQTREAVEQVLSVAFSIFHLDFKVGLHKTRPLLMSGATKKHPPPMGVLGFLRRSIILCHELENATLHFGWMLESSTWKQHWRLFQTLALLEFKESKTPTFLQRTCAMKLWSYLSVAHWCALFFLDQSVYVCVWCWNVIWDPAFGWLGFRAQSNRSEKLFPWTSNLCI